MLRITLEIGLRLCFLWREFISSDSFNLIIGVSNGYVIGNKSLYVFWTEFDILNRFKSIDGGFSRNITRGGKDLFYSSSKFLLSWLVGRFVIILINNRVGLIVSFEKNIENFCLGLIDSVKMFCIFFLCLQGRYCISIIH